MAYPTLEKTFYKDTSSERSQHHEEHYHQRLEAESTFRTGIVLEHGELFCTVPRELSVMTERVLRRERKVSSLWRALPAAALGAYLRSLILDEVVSSNDIEGVHSTRRQIEDALEEAERDTAALSGAAERPHAPFREFACLYLGLTNRDNPPSLPHTLQDIRDIYDAVTRGSLDERDRIKEGLFRSGPVIIEHKGRAIHHGVSPESAICSMLEQMISLLNSEEIPELYSSLLAHFLFEYIHPFYDGNGRTGRYLLALSLSRPLSQATVLSLSRTIAENKRVYYKAFDITEKRANRSEATHFVLTMLDLIGRAQEGVIADLEDKRRSLESLGECVDRLTRDFSEREKSLLYFLGQVCLFGAFGEAKMREGASYLHVSLPTARKAFDSLAQRGLVVRTSGRPAVYRLSSEGQRLLDLS